MKTFVSAVAVFLSATTFSFAQSLPNYGPNAPAQGDSYGKPYSVPCIPAHIEGLMPINGGRITARITIGLTGTTEAGHLFARANTSK